MLTAAKRTGAHSSSEPNINDELCGIWIQARISHMPVAEFIARSRDGQTVLTSIADEYYALINRLNAHVEAPKDSPVSHTQMLDN